MPNSTTDIMKSGAAILSPLLKRYRLQFRIVSEGQGSGGEYCEAVFSDNVRVLELHFRASLGLVTYHLAGEKISHQAYMKALGIAEACAYPGFSDDPLDGFRHLLTDLERFGDDFLSGDGFVLQRAAKAELQCSEQRGHQKMLVSVGDKSSRSEARAQFRTMNYSRVIELLESLQFPDNLSPAERNMLMLAKKKTGEN
jgi:hypothetical protein